MPNSSTHTLVGGLAGLGVALAHQEDENPINPIIASGVGAAFAKLPDILEPATNPHHRQFFHSLAFLAAIGYGLKKAYDWQPEDTTGKFLRGLALCAGVGYASHLLTDGFTPRSLPLLGKL